MAWMNEIGLSHSPSLFLSFYEEQSRVFGSSPFLVRFLSFLTSGEKSEADLARLRSEFDQLVLSRTESDTSPVRKLPSLLPLLFALQLCRTCDATAANVGPLTYSMDAMTFLSGNVESSWFPSRTLLRRALSASANQLDALLVGNLVAKMVLESTGVSGKPGTHGLVSHVAIGDYTARIRNYL